MGMKPFFRREAGQPISRAAARNAALINLLATPGLGSLMARRIAAGAGQVLLAVAGFCVVMAWFIGVMVGLYGMMNDTARPKSAAGLGLTGAAIFALAWVWSLVTSISILREAKADEPTSLPPIPPKIPPKI